MSLTDDIARLFRLPQQARRGLVIDSVVPDSAADKAGLRAGTRTVIVGGESWRLGGDIIVAVEDTPVSTPERPAGLILHRDRQVLPAGAAFVEVLRRYVDEISRQGLLPPSSLEQAHAVA